MITPINGMLLIKEEEKTEKKTASGLVISAALSDLGPKKGTIISVGPGEVNHFTGEFLPMNFKEGETILYPEHSGIDVEDTNGDKYIVLHNKHVIAKIGE
jgi:co-chaperonin GroES (HSP10)